MQLLDLGICRNGCPLTCEVVAKKPVTRENTGMCDFTHTSYAKHIFISFLSGCIIPKLVLLIAWVAWCFELLLKWFAGNMDGSACDILHGNDISTGP